jgi:hydrogenase expression/formation protein HypC
MCLGVPGRVVEVRGAVAIVDYWGARKETRLDVIDEPVAPGDYVLNHVGFAIRKIPASEIQETLALYEHLLRETAADIMASDVRSEIAATGNEPTEA